MNTDRWERVQDIFEAALEQKTDDRAAFLQVICGHDVELWSEVDGLLTADVEAKDFLQEPPIATSPESPEEDTASRMIGKRIGRYHIHGLIASGGMGIVYEAVQEQPHRTVALKVMRRGIASRSALRRFQYEAQIMGRLRHPGIAQIFEAGIHNDDDGTVPYG